MKVENGSKNEIKKERAKTAAPFFISYKQNGIKNFSQESKQSPPIVPLFSTTGYI